MDKIKAPLMRIQEANGIILQITKLSHSQGLAYAKMKEIGNFCCDCIQSKISRAQISCLWYLYAAQVLSKAMIANVVIIIIIKKTIS